MRSYEDSLQRLGLARIDILYIHDIGHLTHGEDNARAFAELAGGGFRALEKLRASGAIAGFGLGVNEWEICLEVMEHTDLDVILLASRYTLLEQGPLAQFLPACVRRGISVVIGGAYNSGILATGTRGRETPLYDYRPASSAVLDRVRRLETACEEFDIPLAAAALQFPLAHPAVVSVIPGLGSVAEVEKTIDLYRTPIPAAFWIKLRDTALLPPDAPLPGGV
jgi:D-threo-aldose 1-dehydrogenase